MNYLRLLHFLLVFFLISLGAVRAQQNILIGAITVGKSESMSYQIIYELDKNNYLSGYSISDLNGSEETKAQIAGFYNPKNKILYFEEKSIISTRSKTPIDEFCLMKVKGRLEKKSGKSIYSGKFNSFCLDPMVVCDSGSILLMPEKDILELKKKVTKAIQKLPVPDSLKTNTDISQDTVISVRKEFNLVPESETEFKLNADFVVLELVDDKYQDGDKVTIMENNKIVLADFEITNRVKTLRFPINKDDKKLTLTIIAVDEGSIALTTIKAVLKNGNESNLINATLDKGQLIRISFIKE